jgi:hypothetical protein
MRHWGIAALAAALFLAVELCVPANAQYLDAAKMKLCSTLTSDGDRLKCYDNVAGATPEKTLAPEGQWQFKESKAPLDDSPQIEASLAGGPKNSTLFLRCEERKSEAIVLSSDWTYLSESSVPVILRINDGAPIKTQWSKSTNGRAVFARNPIDFMRSLPKDGKLFVRIIGHNGETSDATFNLGNVDDARDRVATTCNWSTPKADRATIAKKPK